MRVGAAQHLGVEHPRQGNVDRKALASQHFLNGIGPQYALANDCRIRHGVILLPP
jgi:hypothetical protein